LVWIGSVHSLALGYCRLPTQPWVRFVKLKDSLHYQKFWPECSAWMSSLDGNMLQNSSLRRESAIVESEPVGHGVLLVIVAPCQLFLLSRPEYGRIIPLSEANGSYIARGAPFSKLRSR
jgi:hypothetical protein